MSFPSSFVVAGMVIAVVMACAALGGFLRARLPGHHLDGDTKDSVKAGVGLIATLTALLLSLILASAKSSFETISDEVHQAAGKIVLLDDNLRDMGGGATEVRQALTRLTAGRMAQIWGAGHLAAPTADSPETSAGFMEFRRAIQSAPVADERQQRAQARALQITDEIRQIRFLGQVHRDSAIIAPLVVLIVFWLGLIHLGLNLFAPRNGTIVALNVLSALSVAGAIFLVLEMERPYGGLFRVSPLPMEAALAQLRR